jgi:class 3 adenylate cyclase
VTIADIGGIAVHIAARVAALADAGEVLVSSAVRDLLAGSGLRFEDRDEQGLKGVPDESPCATPHLL